MVSDNSKIARRGANNSPDSRSQGEVELSYPGKIPETDIVQTQAAEVVNLWSNEQDKTRNRLYYGDNLSILASLLSDNSIRGNVQLIYIDPPFSTGSVFQSRSQQDAYPDLLSGARYIEFLRKRLVLLRELLSDDGSIYVHLDHNMAFHIKVIMDEVFGLQNFRAWITRKKCSTKNYTKSTYGNISDYILFYTKSGNYVWNRPLEDWDDARAAREYEYVEEGTGRRYKKVPIHAPGERNGETGKPWRGMNPPPGKHWQFPPDILDAMDERGEIYWSKNGNPRRKIYLDQSNGIPVQDIWLEFRDMRNQNVKITGYPTEKNPDLLRRIIRASSNPNGLILDCFSGSGTTMAVADELNRRWIGIDNSREALQTTLRRFARGAQMMGDYVGRDKNTTTSSKAEVSSLFSDLEDGHMVIDDFALYAEEEYADDLSDAVKDWGAYQRTHA